MIDHRAGRRLAVLGETEIAFELKAELVEIMLVARRKEVGEGVDHLQRKIIGRALDPLGDIAEHEQPGARMVFLDLGNALDGNDLHGLTS